MPVVCNNRCLGSRSAENCVVCAVAAHQQGRLHHCHDAEAVSHAPDCLVDHRDSPLALGHGGRCPCCGTCSCCFCTRGSHLESGHYFAALGMAVLFGTHRLSSTKIRMFLVMASRKCFRIRRMLWFAVDTSTCVSQRWHLEEFLILPTCRWTPDPEVNSLWPPAGSQKCRRQEEYSSKAAWNLARIFLSSRPRTKLRSILL